MGIIDFIETLDIHEIYETLYEGIICKCGNWHYDDSTTYSEHIAEVLKGANND